MDRHPPARPAAAPPSSRVALAALLIAACLLATLPTAPATGQVAVGRSPGLPAPLERKELQALAARLAVGTYPVRAVFAPPPPGITLLVPRERRGLAVALLVEGERPQWLLPAAFRGGALRVEWTPPEGPPCPVHILRRDDELGLLRLAPPEESPCAAPSAPSLRPLPLLDPGPVKVTVRSLTDLGREAIVETFLPPLPGAALPLATPVALLGPGSGAVGFYLLHGAPGAFAAPIVDRQARLVAIACGASWTSPGAGVSIGAHALREFVVGRPAEGLRPHPLPTWRPSWPPATP